MALMEGFFCFEISFPCTKFDATPVHLDCFMDFIVILHLSFAGFISLAWKLSCGVYNQAHCTVYSLGVLPIPLACTKFPLLSAIAS